MIPLLLSRTLAIELVPAGANKNAPLALDRGLWKRWTGRFFPSIGTVNATLTITALALRVAGKIKQRLGTKDQPS